MENKKCTLIQLGNRFRLLIDGDTENYIKENLPLPKVFVSSLESEGNCIYNFDLDTENNSIKKLTITKQ